MTSAEWEAYLIVRRHANPAKPRCAGPLVIHLTGIVECHGPCGAGPVSGLVTFHHDETDVGPCSRKLVRELEVLRSRCARCG